MATPTIHITRDQESGIATATIIFLSDGSTGTIASTAANYKAIIEAITIDSAEEDMVRTLLRPTLTVGKSLKALSERIRYDEGNIYFDGDPIDTSLAKHIVRIIEEGGNENAYKALVNFMEKLYSNPSEKSINSLYDFLLRQDITILPNGDFIAYKGLNRDATSIHAGYGIVDGVAHTNAHLLNNIGSTIEIPRSKVDADTKRGCSTGLHAGSYKYASGFARGLLVTVQVNPRDVVSVPDDCNFQKIRTARYVVLAQTEVEDTRTTWAAADTAEDNDWDADDEDQDDWSTDDEDDTDERTEVEIDLDNQRLLDGARDYTTKPLTGDEYDLFVAAQGEGLYLSDVEADAVSAAEARFIAENAPNIDQAAASATVDLGDFTSFVPGNDKLTAALQRPDVAAAVAELDAEAAADDEFTQRITDKPTPADFADQLNREFADEADLVLNFDYTYAYGETKAVEGFHPRETAEKAEGLLITGKNSDDQWRSYYYCRMANITVRHAGSEGRHTT